MRSLTRTRHTSMVAPVALLILGALFAAGCACTKPDCAFGIISPKGGETLPPGDVDVLLNPRGGNFCTFPPHGYEVALDGGTPVPLSPGAPLKAHFTGVGPGDHTARAVALDRAGDPLDTASVLFHVLAPAPPPPAPTPAPAPPAAVAPPPPGDPEVEAWSKYLKDVFFDFDRSEIRPDQRQALSEDADWLKKHPSVKFTLEGHCDERGTRQYNLALGDRRANAAKEYLVNLGVDESRITTISYGKDRPFDDGHDENAWAKNRRAHFLVTSTK